MAKPYHIFAVGFLNALLGLALENILAVAVIFSGLAINRRKI